MEQRTSWLADSGQYWLHYSPLFNADISGVNSSYNHVFSQLKISMHKYTNKHYLVVV